MSESLFNRIKEGDYCIGCAACTAITNSPLSIKFQTNGTYVAELTGSADEAVMNKAMKVCPFSNLGKNETELGKDLYGSAKNNNEFLGYFESTYAGYVNEGSFRNEGSSGGMGTWILTELFKSGEIDHVIHVKESKEDVLFKFGISEAIEDIQKSAKSRYYPVEMSEVLNIVKNQPGRYAIVGLPCFIKSIRLLSENEPVFKERIKYCVGLVCGHLKSSYFAEMMAMQVGFEKSKFENINFRQKLEGRNAGDYAVKITGKTNGKSTEIIKPTRELFGTNWGHGFFKYNACDYCDDVLAETADITIGDAWLPEYIADSKGTNVIVIRNKKIDSLVKRAITENRIQLDEISAEKIYESQAGGFRHRREGLTYRLALKQDSNEWVPQKRVQPSHNLSKKRKMIYKGRLELNKTSFSAFENALKAKDYSVFENEMSKIVVDYSKLEKVSLIRRIISKGLRLVRGKN